MLMKCKHLLIIAFALMAFTAQAETKTSMWRQQAPSPLSSKVMTSMSSTSP